MIAYYVYIATNHSMTLYVGVTNNLERRMLEPKSKTVPGFTSEYSIETLVYYETTPSVKEAIAREKQIKHWNRSKKLKLISTLNPRWHNLLLDPSTTVGMTGSDGDRD